MSLLRTRWAAVGAAVAVTLGAGGIGLVGATSPGEALTFVPITPCRVLDTRPQFQVGPRAVPLAAGEVHTVLTHGTNGNCSGIPNTAVAVSMNVTATDPTAPTFLTIWARDATRPTASSLNPVPGQPPMPNAVTTELDSAGRFGIYNLAGNVHVFADVNGYYVDHHHDDRYYTKTEIEAGRVVTESFNVRNMNFATHNRSTANGCPTRPTGGQVGTLGLDLPVGAHIDAITAYVFDDSSTVTYNVTVTHFTLTGIGLAQTELGYAAGGASTSASTAVLDLSPTTDTTIAAGDSIFLEFSTTAADFNGFCGLTVRYTLPSL
jgi:hypothetical protein